MFRLTLLLTTGLAALFAQTDPAVRIDEILKPSANRRMRLKRGTIAARRRSSAGGRQS
jgi:hypothetical protein